MEENNLIDREALGQFVDALIAQKNGGQPVDTPPEEREKLMVKVNDAIGQAVLGRLSSDKFAELDQGVETGKISSDQIRDYLINNGVNIDEEVKNALQSFADNYLGGTI